MAASDPDPRNFIDKSQYPKIETLQVTAASTFMRRGPRPSAAAETELLYGTLFHVYKRGRGWVWGQAECQLPGSKYPGYVGWTRIRDLGPNLGRSTHKVTALSAPIFQQKDIKSPVVYHLPLASTFEGKRDGSFTKITDGYVHNNHISKISTPAHQNDWIAVAETMMGRPYVWGGVSSEGLDCSGLVQTALRVFGSDAPRDTDQQAGIGQAVKITNDLSGLKRGDLIFWKGHVGIMTSPSRLLHANAHHMMVASEPLVTAVKRIGPVTGIRRLPS